MSGRLARAATVWLALLAVSWVPALHAQETAAERAAKIKAAYLYKFISYVEWPETSFRDAQAPLVIGTFGDHLVNGYLQVIAENRTAGDRPLAYLPVTEPEQAGQCHILFVSDRVEPKMWESLMRSVQDEPVLLVGARRGFAESGGVIGFMLIDNNIRLQISLEAASQRGLSISSQLAKVAQIVD